MRGAASCAAGGSPCGRRRRGGSNREESPCKQHRGLIESAGVQPRSAAENVRPLDTSHSMNLQLGQSSRYIGALCSRRVGLPSTRNEKRSLERGPLAQGMFEFVSLCRKSRGQIGGCSLLSPTCRLLYVNGVADKWRMFFAFSDPQANPRNKKRASVV